MTVPTNARLRTNLALSVQAFSFRDPVVLFFNYIPVASRVELGEGLSAKFESEPGR